MDEITTIDEMNDAILYLIRHVEEREAWKDIYNACPNDLKTNESIIRYLKNVFVAGYFQAVRDMVENGDIK